MKKLLDKTGLTKRELIIISFLFIAFTAGLILKYSGWKNPEDFDYTDYDSEFDKRVKTGFEELEKNKMTPGEFDKSAEMKKFADSLIALKDSEGKNKKQLPAGKKLNINTAYAGDLQLLPGIGEVTAERIIEYREQKGLFKRVEDIKKVKGIGDKKFEQIKEYIMVE